MSRFLKTAAFLTIIALLTIRFSDFSDRHARVNASACPATESICSRELPSGGASESYIDKPSRGLERYINNKGPQVHQVYHNKLTLSGIHREVKLLNFFSRYISYCGTITQSLSVRNIVFPFHYFW